MLYVYSERANIQWIIIFFFTLAEYQLQDTILLELDIALPPNPENKSLPLVVVIHRGLWMKNSRILWQDTKDYATLGYIGCTINYRLNTTFLPN